MATYEGGRVILALSMGDPVDASLRDMESEGLIRQDASSEALIAERRAALERELRRDRRSPG